MVRSASILGQFQVKLQTNPFVHKWFCGTIRAHASAVSDGKN
jgi:hypothetical protein